MKRQLLHVLGGGPWQLPTVRLAKQLGFRVLVSDIYVKRPAYAVADIHEVVDITDPIATLSLAERYRIDGILCDTTDTGVRTAAYVADKLKLPGIGIETARNFTDKSRMRTLTAAAGCSSPSYRLVTGEKSLMEAVEELGMPVVVKPVDNQSGRGVTLVKDRNKLHTAYIHALGKSRSSFLLVETYIAGDEYIVDGFMVDGVAYVLGIARKIPNATNPTVADHITYQPRVNNKLHQRLTVENQRALSALGLYNGIFHAEYRVHGVQVFPVDLAARGGGCMIYSHILPRISGVDANREMVNFAMGRSVSIQPRFNRAANIEFLQVPYGILGGITGMDAALAVSGVITSHMNAQNDDRIDGLREKDDRPGYLIAVADSTEQAMRITADAVSRLSIKLRDSDRAYLGEEK